MEPIAYIISADKDATQLARLVNALDYRADFYVHVDLKADIEPFKALLGKRVHFVKRHWVSWGGYSQVKYQQELLKAVIDSGKRYSRVMALSGLDYPLWSNRKIHAFFEENAGKEFISGINSATQPEPTNRRKVCRYHFFRDLEWRNNWLKNKLIVSARIVMKILPLRKPAYTFINKQKADVYFGADWWAITYECARHVSQVLECETKMRRYFRTSFAPSELCIQTIVFNSPFARKAILHEGNRIRLKALTPLHYIDYERAIKVFTSEDKEKILQSDKMFFRKAMTGISDRLMDEIDTLRTL